LEIPQVEVNTHLTAVRAKGDTEQRRGFIVKAKTELDRRLNNQVKI
jgi:hypothetical protein